MAEAAKSRTSVKPASAAKAAKPAQRLPKKRLPRSRYSREEITEIFTRFRELRPEPRGELYHTNPYTLVVAVALSAQATDEGVNRATKHLFAVADTP